MAAGTGAAIISRAPVAVARTNTGNGSGYAASQAGIQPGPPPGRKRRRPYGERYVRRLIASIVVAGVLAGGGIVSRRLSSDTGADYPVEWDARVQDLAEFVENVLVDDEIALSKVSILGFYNPFDETVVVRGNEVTPALRSVLVHELTHVLQEQWFETERVAGFEACERAAGSAESGARRAR